MTVRIERITPRGGVAEHPYRSSRGFELVDDRVKGQKNKVAQATFVRTIEEAAYLVEQGYSLRMTGPAKRASLISPQGLRIVRT